jgi:flagellar basal-body rod protein FlgG
MMAQQLNVEMISHNLANISTTGFKRQRAEFQDLLYQSQSRVGTNSSDAGTVVPTGIQLGLGVKTGAVYRIHDQGTLQNTENPLDLAINGKGFFRVELPDGGFAYTRSGAFQLSPEGEIVTPEGFLVSPGIIVPEDAIEISVNQVGEVQAKVDVGGEIQAQDLGQLDIVRFVNDGGLEAKGDNLFYVTASSGEEIVGVAGEEGFGTIIQGFLESSNVNPVTEITNMILAQRAYEMNSKVITTSEEMLQTAANSKR